jgi:hypothetical protein
MPAGLTLRHQSSKRLSGSPAIVSARGATPIRGGAAIVRLGFGGVEMTPPFVELFPQGVDSPPMIRCAEPLLFRH